jgi:translocation and assembly module TamB
MRILKRLLWTLTGLLGLLMLITVALLSYFGASQEGTRHLFELLQEWAPGQLRLTSLEGRLAGPLRITGLAYRQEDGLVIENQRLRFDWQPSALLHGRLSITELGLEHTKITLPRQTETAPKEPYQGISLPLAISIEGCAVTHLRIQTSPDEQPLSIDSITLNSNTEDHELQISNLYVQALNAEVTITGRMGLDEQLPLHLNLDWRYLTPQGVPLQGKGEIVGDLDHYRFAQHLDSPLLGQVDGDLLEVLNAPNWKAVVKWDEVNLAAFNQDFPALIQGSIMAQGDFERFTLDSALVFDEPRFGVLNSQLVAHYDQEKLHIESLRISNPKTLEIEAGGEYRWEKNHFFAQLKWQDLSWPLTGPPEVASQQGRLELSGALEGYDYQFEGAVSKPKLPPVQIQASGQGDVNGIALATLSLRQQENRLEGRGDLVWSPEPQWDLVLNAKHINPAVVDQDFQGDLDLSLNSRGSVRNGRLEGDVRLAKLKGHLRDYPLEAQGQIILKQDMAEIPEITLNSGGNLIRLKGALGENIALDWTVDAPRLAAFWPELSGQLQASGRVQGKREKPSIDASLDAHEIAYKTYALKRLKGEVDLDMAQAQSIEFSLNGADLAMQDKRWDRLEMAVSGTLPKHHITMSLQGEQVPQFSLEAHAGLAQNNLWRGRLEGLNIDALDLGRWRLTSPVRYQMGARNQRLEALCLDADISRICGSYSGDAQGRWHSELQLTDFRIETLQSWLTHATQLAGRLTLNAKMASEAPGQLQADMTMSVPQGEVTFQVEGEEQTVDFSKTLLSAELDARKAVAQVQLPLQGLGGFEGKLILPEFEIANPARRNQPMSGNIKGNIDNLAFLKLFAPQLRNSQGQLFVDFALGGNLSKPHLFGQAQLEGGRFDVPVIGIELRDLTVQVKTPTLNRLEVTGRVRSGNGQLNWEGYTQLSRDQSFVSEYQIKGKEWLAVDLPEAEVWISPQLSFKHGVEGNSLTGKLHVPYARLRPRELPQSAVSSSSDVVIIGEEYEEASSRDAPMHTKLRLSLGKRVSFDGFGLRGRFTGGLLVIDEPGRPVIGRGRLGIADGVYQAYGQDLKIERGFALFADSPVENPGLDVRAVREVDDVTAGMRITGTLKKPKLTLFSTPSMVESDVLTYLLTGRAPGESSESVGIAAALKASGAGTLATELGRRFGLEELRVDAGSSLEDASLVAGTYLSPRLYVQYINELSTSETKLRMRYDLTDRWQLEAETGRTQAGDFFYTFER